MASGDARAGSSRVTCRSSPVADAVGQSGNSISLASLDQSDTNPSNDFASATVNIVEEADLAIAKSNSPTVAEPGDVVTYTITITNNGPNAARNVTGFDPYLTNANVIGNDPPPPGTTYDPVTRTWSIPALANQQSLSLVVTDPGAPGPVRHVRQHGRGGLVGGHRPQPRQQLGDGEPVRAERGHRGHQERRPRSRARR